MQTKEAADKMLADGHITQEEYNALGEFGAFEKYADLRSLLAAVRKLPGAIKATGPVIKEFALPMGAGLTGIAIFKESIVDPIMEANKIKRSLAAVKEKVPALAEKDQEQMQDYFDVVKTFSPKSASNPLVAGALVNKMMEFGGVDHKLVQDISAIEQGIQRPRVSQTVAEGAAKAVAGAGIKA